jgi:hypothetical protein
MFSKFILLYHYEFYLCLCYCSLNLNNKQIICYIYFILWQYSDFNCIICSYIHACAFSCICFCMDINLFSSLWKGFYVILWGIYILLNKLIHLPWHHSEFLQFGFPLTINYHFINPSASFHIWGSQPLEISVGRVIVIATIILLYEL